MKARLLLGIIVLSLSSAAFGQVIPNALPKIAPPVGFDEGTEVKLSAEQLKDLLPYATNSRIEAVDALDTTSRYDSKAAIPKLKSGIRHIVEQSLPLRSELLMRFVLNRALLIAEELERHEPVDPDSEARLLRRSLEFSIQYAANDENFLKQTATLPYAQFGLEYAQFLMILDQSLMNSVSQYNVAVTALGLLQWDLYRDEERNKYAPAIFKINALIQGGMVPTSAAENSPDILDNLRSVKSTYRKAIATIAITSPKNTEVTNSESEHQVIKSKCGADSLPFQVGAKVEYVSQVPVYVDGINQTPKNFGKRGVILGRSYASYYKIRWEDGTVWDTLNANEVDYSGPCPVVDNSDKTTTQSPANDPVNSRPGNESYIGTGGQGDEGPRILRILLDFGISGFRLPDNNYTRFLLVNGHLGVSVLDKHLGNEFEVDVKPVHVLGSKSDDTFLFNFGAVHVERDTDMGLNGYVSAYLLDGGVFKQWGDDSANVFVSGLLKMLGTNYISAEGSKNIVFKSPWTDLGLADNHLGSGGFAAGGAGSVGFSTVVNDFKIGGLIEGGAETSQTLTRSFIKGQLKIRSGDVEGVFEASYRDFMVRGVENLSYESGNRPEGTLKQNLHGTRYRLTFRFLR